MKHLILRFIREIDDMIDFRIESQSHRGSEFCEPYGVFEASNGYLLSSVGCPAINGRHIDLYVQGVNEEYDAFELRVTINRWTCIKEAVRDYNNYFGYEGESIIGELKPIPMEMFVL